MGGVLYEQEDWEAENRSVLSGTGWFFHSYVWIIPEIIQVWLWKLKDKVYREYPVTYQTKHDVEDQEDKKKNESKYIVHNCKCEKFAKHGVRIRLIACRCYCREDSFCMGSGYYLKMVINPRKLIEPADKYRYLGILPPNEESVNQVTKAFKELFHKTIFKKNMDDYKV